MKRDCLPTSPTAFCRLHRSLQFLIVASSFVLVSGTVTTALEPTESTGDRIYRARCIKCHGENGQGTVEHYPSVLAGDRSIPQLVELISRSMPPDSEQKCVGEEAENVATYIFNAFYSPQTRSRQPAPSLRLNRLTARQYRHAIADLMTSFRGGTGVRDEKQGLSGNYIHVEPNGDGEHAMNRLDPEIHFDFGKNGPDPEKINPREFSIMWSGSVQAPSTGEYEFIVRCEQSVMLKVNHRVRPLIDAWVKSGDDKEYRAKVKLLGGRNYPVEFNFTKAGQGVQKTADQKAKEEVMPTSIHLSWIAPGRTEQTITKQYLSPYHFPESYFVETPFPPDDRSTGFEQGNSVSKEWDQATTNAAIEVADYVTSRLNDLSGGAEPGPEYEQKLRVFCTQFVERAFRRKLTDEQRQTYVDQQFASTPDLETAVQRVVILTLKSPRFLYQGLSEGTPDGFDTASRLSFALWDAPPDAALFAAAAEGRLADREHLRHQADRLSHDPRCAFKLKEFLLQWMKLDQVRELTKSAKLFPGFDAETASDLRTSLELFLEDVTKSEAADFRRLFVSRELYLNGRLSKLYGGDLPAAAPFQPVYFEPDQRAGLMSHPYLMSVFADSTETSPIRRGVFLARGVLGRALLPPVEAVTILPPSLHPELNTRERILLQTKAESCQTCHAMINPLGFPLENFDAIGRYRAEEKSRPIDSSGYYLSRRGETQSFKGACDLAEYLAQSDEVHLTFVEKLFQFAVQQSPRTYGPDTSSRLKASFVENQFNLRKLLAEIAIVAAMGPASLDTGLSQK